MTEECADSSEEEKEDISEDLFDDSEEVSLLELDPDKLAEAMDEAGISIKVLMRCPLRCWSVHLPKISLN